ncbi:MAG: phosphatidylserine decarboxylase family protein [Candidatus Zixiibacteriota bacterium]
MVKEGANLVVATLIFSLVLFFLSILLHGEILFIGGGLFLAFSMLFSFLFRDPERKIPQGENLVLAPADGRIVSLENFSENEFLKSPGMKMSIFLSLWDPHINRNPVSGVVKNLKYHPGRFHPAFREKSSLENEQTEIWLENEKVRVIMKQIAGILARRIICRLKPGEMISAGKRFGMIKFGSRVELYLPGCVEIDVQLNEKVKAGETIIGSY